MMTADVLTWSDERGYHSHGAVRVEYYSERIAKGGITVDPKFEWRETGPCSAVFEGDNGCGYVASVLAMEKAIEMAKKSGIAVVGIRNISHSGSIGYYTEMGRQGGSGGDCMLPVRSDGGAVRRDRALLRYQPHLLCSPHG